MKSSTVTSRYARNYFMIFFFLLTQVELLFSLQTNFHLYKLFPRNQALFPAPFSQLSWVADSNLHDPPTLTLKNIICKSAVNIYETLCL